MIGAAELAAPTPLSPPVSPIASPMGSLTATGVGAPMVHGPSRGAGAVARREEERVGAAAVETRREAQSPTLSPAHAPISVREGEDKAKTLPPAHPPTSLREGEKENAGSESRSTQDTAAIWAKVVRTGGAQDPMLRAVLVNMTLVSLSPSQATIAVEAVWAPRAAKWTARVAELIGQQTGSTVSVLLQSPVTGEERVSDVVGEGSNGSESAGASVRERPVVGNAADHPLVKVAMELFGGRVVDVKPRR